MVRQACPELAEGLTTNVTRPVRPEPVEGRYQGLGSFSTLSSGLGIQIETLTEEKHQWLNSVR